MCVNSEMVLNLQVRKHYTYNHCVYIIYIRIMQNFKISSILFAVFESYTLYKKMYLLIRRDFITYVKNISSI